MPKFTSFKTKYKGFKFNSKWELSIFKTLMAVVPTSCLPIKVNEKIPGHRFELDFYIPKLNIAFELQGPTHFFFVKTIYNDLRKAIVCKNTGIKLFYLNYNKYYGKQYFLKVLNLTI